MLLLAEKKVGGNGGKESDKKSDYFNEDNAMVKDMKIIMEKIKKNKLKE